MKTGGSAGASPCCFLSAARPLALLGLLLALAAQLDLLRLVLSGLHRDADARALLHIGERGGLRFLLTLLAGDLFDLGRLADLNLLLRRGTGRGGALLLLGRHLDDDRAGFLPRGFL